MREGIARSSRKTLAISFLRLMVSKTFSGVHVSTITSLQHSDYSATIYYANHSSLWDFAITSFITYFKFHQDPFTMTAEKTMMPLAEWAGSFSVNYRDPYSVAKTLKYCQSLLYKKSDSAVWIYPQGFIYPTQKRPLVFKKGINFLLNGRPNVKIVPVSIYYTFGHHTKPEAFLTFGKPLNTVNVPKELLPRYLEDVLADQLDNMIIEICNLHTHKYETVLIGLPDLRKAVLKVTRKPYPPLKTWGNWYEE